MPYLWATSDSLLSALLKIFTLFCLGNPILLLIVAFDLFRGPENLKKTLLKPDKRNPSLPDYQFLGLLIVQGFAAISLLVYVAIVIRALAMEPVSEGWTYIKADLWSFVTFIDNLLGILFAMAYITCREHGSVLNALVWAATLFFLGNGVTCVYVLLLTRRKESVQEAFLSDESVTRLAQGFHRID